MIDDDEPFRLEEATIDDVHRAISAGRTTCVAIVESYIEPSVTSRGDFDRHPSEGPPPPVCEQFRQLPDALERAAELDATYGRPLQA
jgi:hypothetical protein